MTEPAYQSLPDPPGPPRPPSPLRDFHMGEWHVQPSLGRVERHGAELRLRPQLMDVLRCLARRAGHVVGRDEIFSAVWPEHYVADSGLARCIAELRQIFADDAHEPTVIETIPKRGYRLLLPVVWADDSAGPAGTSAAGAPLASAVVGHTGCPPDDAHTTPDRDVFGTFLAGAEPGGAYPAPCVTDQEGPMIPGCSAAALDEPVAPWWDNVARVARHSRSGRGWVESLVGTAVIAAAMGTLGVLRTTPVPALSDRDTVVLAFDNATADKVFDGTLRLALAVQLDQSPFLRVLSEERTRDTLAYMARQADTPITRAVAVELCERAGAKVVIAGSITSLGSHYVMGLEAVACRTGESLAREQVEVDSKEAVLQALGNAASRLRGRLGESRASIQSFDVPLEQATTSSLKALQYVSLGDTARRRGDLSGAIDLYREAQAEDPAFALAYARTGAQLTNLGRNGEAAEAQTKAFALRNRVSATERWYISGHYYWNVEDNLVRAIEMFEAWKRAYPQAVVPRVNLANLYVQTGRFEEGIAEARVAVQLDPREATAYDALAEAYQCSGRFDDAIRVVTDMVARKMDTVNGHDVLYSVALLRGDAAAAQAEIEWAQKRVSATTLFTLPRARAAMFAGSFRQARDLWTQVRGDAGRRGDQRAVATAWLLQAAGDALLGEAAAARAAVDAALNADRSSSRVARAAFVMGLAGEADIAARLVPQHARVVGPDTLRDADHILPAQAVLALLQGRPQDAIDRLQPTAQYELGLRFELRPLFVRGLALRRAGRVEDAAREFERLIAARYVTPDSVLYPLAWLFAARCHVEAGNVAKARDAYAAFFALWKDADPDVRLLQRAHAEFAALP
jgi:eukaryotic-like serine/threonine-protein kinase